MVTLKLWAKGELGHIDPLPLQTLIYKSFLIYKMDPMNSSGWLDKYLHSK